MSHKWPCAQLPTLKLAVGSSHPPMVPAHLLPESWLLPAVELPLQLWLWALLGSVSMAFPLPGPQSQGWVA